MDRIREIHTSSNKIEGKQHIYKEKGTSKLASPNVVARLMGLDGMPSPEVIHRPQKTLANNNRQKTLPKMSQRDSLLCEARSYKKSYVEQPQFKDVFEDTIKKSGSSKDSTVELLQQSDSLFPEHPRMQKSPSRYTYNHIAVLKPSNSAKQKARAKGWKAETESPVKDDIVSKQKQEDDFLRHTYSSHGSQSLIKSSIIPANGKGESDIVAKRIVILKPNYVKAQNCFNSFSSPDSSYFNFSDDGNQEQYANTSRAECYFRNMNSLKDMDFSRLRSGEVTETVKKVTREMRVTSSRMMNRRDAAKESNGKMIENCDYMMTNIPSPVRGNPDIRGLYDFSGNVSASKSEGMRLTSYDLTESFVSSEAKKRLLERLKKAHKYQDAGVNSKGSIPREMYQDVGVDGKKITLGEMLSTPDAKIRNLDVRTGGISSRDGWNGSYSKLSSRSRSVRSLSGRISEKQNPGEYRVDDKLLVPAESTSQYQMKVVKRNCKMKENSSSKNSRSRKRRSQSDRQRYAYNSDSLLESCSSQDQMGTNLNKKGFPDEQLVVPQTPNNVVSIVDAADSIHHGSRTLSHASSDEFPPELSICMKNYDYPSVGDQDDSTPQRTKAETESAESSMVADNPSPISVLEVPLREDDVLSCPESFEQVSADLRELQKQLQLLKRESKSYAAASTLNIDCDVRQGPVTGFENRGIHTPECWESSYMVDVLIESGFDDTNTDMLMATCYSPDCPLGPWVFDNLENKQFSEVTGLKHERRLLFDRINSALSEILKSFMEPCPWVRPSTVGIGFKWQKCEIRDELPKLLRGQEKEVNEGVPEKLLDKEMNWVGWKNSIDAIGMEIEKLLADELLTELVNDVEFLN